MSTKSEEFPTFLSPVLEKRQGFTAYAIQVNYPLQPQQKVSYNHSITVSVSEPVVTAWMHTAEIPYLERLCKIKQYKVGQPICFYKIEKSD